MITLGLAGPDGVVAAVDGAQAVHVITRPLPPLEPQRTRFFRQYMTTDGTPGGSNDMGIDGSGTPVEFFIPADTKNDRYITNLSFEITCGSAPQMWEFADANTALANGIRLYYLDTNQNEIDIHDGMKDNWTMYRLARGLPTITGGSTADVFIARHVGAANDYGLIPNVDLAAFMPPFGVKLDRASNEKLALVIRDDCTDGDVFNVIAYGFDRLPD